ncbi:MAG: hypothetical protein A3J08_02850 [Candidatus Lloydbacteria bacterium RIFCSPLOWO2_02_FULL_51_11]|nr:MAG: hypothetical protein A3J08_02850 [Candidatus Lloydbacteria bacterium RIFCSPLOWO2_02_FULL_51_11]
MSIYTEQEIAHIVDALKILGEKGFPVPPQVFDAWCGACITVPIELAVLRKASDGTPEVLMIHRDDKFFLGWHIPGSILLPGETEEIVFRRLARKEVIGRISPPQFIDRMHTMKGNENSRGQEVSLLFACFFENQQSPVGQFFPLHNPPEDTIGEHKPFLKRIARW